MAQEDKRLRRKVRNSYLVSTISIAMVLFLLGSVTYLILNALNVTNRLKESVTIYVMLDDGLSGEQTDELKKRIEANDVVRQLTYVSKEEAAEKFIEETDSDFRSFIDFNPLPNSFEVGLNARSSDKELVHAFDREISAMRGVNEVVYQKSVVEKIGTNLNKFNLVLLLFGAALLVISLILLNNTIHMTIAAKRHIINTMKLVGATGGFIMRPFLGSAALHGVYAGLIASLMFIGMIAGLQEGIPEIALLKSNTLVLSISGAMIAGGILISLLFTIFAVDRSVNMSAGRAYM